MENKKKILLYTIIAIAIIIVSVVILKNTGTQQVNTDSKSKKQYKIGEMVTLEEKDKVFLREKTIEHIKNNLKAPTTAEFGEFKYICNEENIIRVEGYVDSQNSFGAMLRGNFVCEYFALDIFIDTLVYLKYNNEELMDIKEIYREECKKEQRLEEAKSSGSELNIEKLQYIMEEFNNDEVRNAGKIINVSCNEGKSIVDIQVIAENLEKRDNKQYWVQYNITGIINDIGQFDNVGEVELKLYIDNTEIAYAKFNEEFLRNVWKENHIITKIPELFGENYKEMF